MGNLTDATPNYDMTLYTDNDSMADSFDVTPIGMGQNWFNVSQILNAVSVSSLPISDFSYSLGDRVYHTGTKSVYVLIAQDALWGNFWLPVQARYGPWIQPSSSIITNTDSYTMGSPPVQYRLTNFGRIMWTGCVSSTDLVNGFVDFVVASNPKMFNNLPDVIGPAGRVVYGAPVYPVKTAAPAPTLSQFIWTNTTQAASIWNPSGTSLPATKIFMDGLEWNIGQSLGYDPFA